MFLTVLRAVATFAASIGDSRAAPVWRTVSVRRGALTLDQLTTPGAKLDTMSRTIPSLAARIGHALASNESIAVRRTRALPCLQCEQFGAHPTDAKRERHPYTGHHDRPKEQSECEHRLVSF
jgi:hypothetical protein